MPKKLEDKDLEAVKLSKLVEDFIKGKIPANRADTVGKKVASLLGNPEALKAHQEAMQRYEDYLGQDE